MCLKDNHVFSIDQLLYLLREENPKEFVFLGIDFNIWEPHVKTTISILSLLTAKGFPCLYMRKKFGILPQFGKPYFGTKSKKAIVTPASSNFKQVDFGDQQTNLFLLSEVDQKLMFEDLSKVETGKDLAELKFGNFDFGYAILSTICSMYGKGELSQKLIRQVGPKVLATYIETVNSTFSHLINNRVTSLIVFNGRFVNEKAAVSAAKYLDIPVFFHEASKDNSYSFSCFSPLDIYGYLELSKSLTSEIDSSIISKDSEKWYRSRIDGLSADTAHFQAKWDNFKTAPSQISVNQKRISIFTTSDDEYLGLSEDWDLPQKRSQKEWIASIAKLALRHNYEVILRLHPNLKTKSKSLQRDWVELSQIKGIKIVGFGDRCNSYSLVKSSDLIVTCGSTIAMEAGFLNKPVLSVGTGIYDGLNAVRKVQDLDLIDDILYRGEFEFLIPDRNAVECFGYTELNKFNQISSNQSENRKITTMFVKTSLINKVFSRIYRDLLFRYR